MKRLTIVFVAIGLMVCGFTSLSVARDLEITDISWSPLMPNTGEEVVFDITIRNIYSEEEETVTEDFNLKCEVSVDEGGFDQELDDLLIERATILI